MPRRPTYPSIPQAELDERRSLRERARSLLAQGMTTKEMRAIVGPHPWLWSKHEVIPFSIGMDEFRARVNLAEDWFTSPERDLPKELTGTRQWKNHGALPPALLNHLAARNLTVPRSVPSRRLQPKQMRAAALKKGVLRSMRALSLGPVAVIRRFPHLGLSRHTISTWMKQEKDGTIETSFTTTSCHVLREMRDGLAKEVSLKSHPMLVREKLSAPRPVDKEFVKVHPIRRELVAATGIHLDPLETGDAFEIRLVRAGIGLSMAKWNALSRDAQKWLNECVRAMKRRETLPPMPSPFGPRAARADVVASALAASTERSPDDDKEEGRWERELREADEQFELDDGGAPAENVEYDDEDGVPLTEDSDEPEPEPAPTDEMLAMERRLLEIKMEQARRASCR